MTSDFAGNAEHGETVRQDQKDEMPENMLVENTMAMASPQTLMFEIHRAEPEEFYQEPSDSYVQPTAEQDVPELSECYSEPEPVETYAEVQQVQEPVSENVPNLCRSRRQDLFHSQSKIRSLPNRRLKVEFKISRKRLHSRMKWLSVSIIIRR